MQRLTVVDGRSFFRSFAVLAFATFGLAACGDARVTPTQTAGHQASSDGPVPTPTLPKDVPGLVAALSDPSSEVRRLAAEALGKAGNPAAALPLLKELDDKDVYARKAAAEALGLALEKAPAGTPGRTEAVDALIRLLGDPDYGVRYNSVEGLSRLRSQRAVPALAAALEKDTDENVRGHAAWALGQTGDRAAVEPLIAALRNGRADPWKVSYALGELGGPEATDVLMTGLRKKKYEMVSGAAEFFAKRNDPELQTLLLEMLRKTNDGAVADAFLLSTDPALVAAGRAFWGENRRTTTMDEQGRVTREQAK